MTLHLSSLLIFIYNAFTRNRSNFSIATLKHRILWVLSCRKKSVIRIPAVQRNNLLLVSYCNHLSFTLRDSSFVMSSRRQKEGTELKWKKEGEFYSNLLSCLFIFAREFRAKHVRRERSQLTSCSYCVTSSESYSSPAACLFVSLTSYIYADNLPVKGRWCKEEGIIGDILLFSYANNWNKTKIIAISCQKVHLSFFKKNSQAKVHKLIIHLHMKLKQMNFIRMVLNKLLWIIQFI